MKRKQKNWRQLRKARQFKEDLPHIIIISVIMVAYCWWFVYALAESI